MVLQRRLPGILRIFRPAFQVPIPKPSAHRALLFLLGVLPPPIRSPLSHQYRIQTWRTQKCLLLSTRSIYIFNRHHLAFYPSPLNHWDSQIYFDKLLSSFFHHFDKGNILPRFLFWSQEREKLFVNSRSASCNFLYYRIFSDEKSRHKLMFD